MRSPSVVPVPSPLSPSSFALTDSYSSCTAAGSQVDRVRRAHAQLGGIGGGTGEAARDAGRAFHGERFTASVPCVKGEGHLVALQDVVALAD